jgi:hypothetical protein
MIQKLKMILLSVSYLFVMMLPLTVAMTPSASAQSIQTNLCQGADQLNVDTTDNGVDGTCAIKGTDACDVDCVVRKVVNILSIIVGVVAVIMIIVAGFRYITSGGKQESVTAAKNTILYAVIGLIIVALAQVIVRFVLTKSTTASS